MGYYDSLLDLISKEVSMDQNQLFGNFIPYPGNPIIQNTGNQTVSGWGSVIKDVGIYYYYFSSEESPTYRLKIYRATSTDGKVWTKEPAILLDSGGSGKFDETNVWLPRVWKEGATWYMAYSGHGIPGYAIGLATSPDGTTWTRQNGGDPILDGTASAWDDTDVELGTIIKVGSTYYMWYNNVANGAARQVGLATSTDRIHWTKDLRNPILPAGRFCVDVFKYADFYYMIVPHYSYGTSYADLELYRDSSPLFSAKEYLGVIRKAVATGWDNYSFDTPYVLTDDIYRNTFNSSGGQLWMYYGADAPTGGWQTGLLIAENNSIIPTQESSSLGFGLLYAGDLNAAALILNTSNNFANDAAAAAGGIKVGGVYHTSGALKIRLV